MNLPESLKTHIEELLHLKVLHTQPVSGGCIHQTQIAKLEDGQEVFIKNTASTQPTDCIEKEAIGLQKLALCAQNIDEIHVPQLIAWSTSCLIMERVHAVPMTRAHEQTLGQGLAKFHLASQQDTFGFEIDNYLGSTPQQNTEQPDWPTFWKTCRLEPMLNRLSSEAEVNRLGTELLDQLDDLLQIPQEKAVLLHGDLWSGNVLADEQGRAVLIDHACYWGHREAEFGMTRLFGFGQTFENAYTQISPFHKGADRRIKLYTLHHLLNHLLLFGSGYRADSIRCLKELLR